MTAFPEYMDEGSILREYEDGQARIIAEDVNGGYRADVQPALPLEQQEPTVSRRISLLEAITVIRDAQRCPDCGKTRAIINLGRGIRPEKVSPVSHCACPAGPAYRGTGGTF